MLTYTSTKKSTLEQIENYSMSYYIISSMHVNNKLIIFKVKELFSAKRTLCLQTNSEL